MLGLVERTLIGAHGDAERHQMQLSVTHDEFHLAKDGHFWTLSRGTQRVLLKDAKGMTYLAELMRHPGRDVHVLDLIALLASPAGAEIGSFVAGREPLATGWGAGHADELLDAKARRAYLRQARSLTTQLAAAEAAGDPEQRLALQQELDALRRELARATGLGGRSRRASDAERARVNVTRTIRLALAHLAEVAPELGGELARRVRTGTFCQYSPDRTFS